MKKMMFLCATVFALLLSANAVQAQAGGIAKGSKYVNWKFPDSITVSKTVTFPTAATLAPTWASDSVNVKSGEFYTYVSLDTLKGTRRVKLSAQSYLTGGAQLVVEAVSDTATRSFILMQAAGNDTLSVTGRKRLQLYYTGSKFVPVGGW